MKKAVLVQRNEPESEEYRNSSRLQELKELAESAGYLVVDEVTQTKNPDRNYQIGRGKADELSRIVAETGANKIIFYNQLSIMQIYNISQTCRCETIDKFHLILEIFATKAKTKRAKYQVELAKLHYELPKAKTIVSLLKKKERPGFMGLGSYEDSYEKDIKNRISRLRNELGRMQKDYENLRTTRHNKGFSIVALAGYTNAGKSTLFSEMVDENVEVENRLFTTLSPTTRSFQVNGRKLLLTDTVGFIEDLPHWLIDAFKSTLDEIFLADVILLVVDVSEPVEIIKKKLVACHDTLWEQIEDAPIIAVLNKVDRISEEDLVCRISEIEYLTPNPIIISASEGTGIETLKQKIFSYLPVWKRKDLQLPISDSGMSIASWLFDEGIVHNIKYTDRILVDVEARDEVINKAKAVERELHAYGHPKNQL
ncbi:GTP-binding proten HflX [Methanosalsum zhilinae DSM 4017]|uniref:GTPase HflX n=1 Tax=Methanosalsum zhilinae (strain DSM 4017 / NBRC 107636 / OCM 62 / WeN5) TaxID=679901 RepID=F7XPR8_METZD|nr:GTPase HflX [Methanosalsum zhilinae]AEH60338.1 GTP-binding proten HflX [Methanosalsum zhilinae DSM 4017]